MDWIAPAWHLAGFAAPAACCAAATVCAARLFWRPHNQHHSTSWRQRLLPQMMCNFLAGFSALLAGLIITGHDGRISTYAALIFTSAACQAWMMR